LIAIPDKKKSQYQQVYERTIGQGLVNKLPAGLPEISTQEIPGQEYPIRPGVHPRLRVGKNILVEKSK